MLYFVGEKRSQQAINNNWHWDDNVSTARYLLDCLKEIGIIQEDIIFRNLWDDDGYMNTDVVAELRNTPYPIIGMGNTVCNRLASLYINHHCIIHPAARGKIRKKERYIAHLKEKLGWVIATEKIIKEREDVWKALANM